MFIDHADDSVCYRGDEDVYTSQQGGTLHFLLDIVYHSPTAEQHCGSHSGNDRGVGGWPRGGAGTLPRELCILG